MGGRYRYGCVLQVELIKTGNREFSVGNGWLDNYFPFQARSQNCDKRLLALSCLSVRMKQLVCSWTDFHKA
jgi:hypothetical protein